MAVLASLNVLINADARGFGRDLNRSRRSVRHFERATTRSFAKVATAAAGLATAVLSIRSALNQVNQAIITFSGFEDLRSSLAAVTGSAQAGAMAFDDIIDFARRSQFDINNLTIAYTKLAAAGIQPTEKLLRTFADAAAISTDELGTLEAISNLFARTTSGGLGLEELESLLTRGVPVFRLLEEQVGITRTEISEFGKTAEGAGILLDGLIRGIEEDFGGASLARLNNLSTAVRKIRDEFKLLQDEFVGAFASELIRTFQILTGSINSSESAAMSLGTAVRDALAEFNDNLPEIIDNLSNLASTLRDIGPLLGNVVSGLINLGIVLGTLRIVTIVLGWIAGLAAALGAFAATPVIAGVAVIAGLATIFIDLNNALRIVAFGFRTVWEWLSLLLFDIVSFPVKIGAAITDFLGITQDAVGAINSYREEQFAVTQHFNAMLDAARGFGDSTIEIFENLSTAINGTTEELEDFNTAIGEMVLQEIAIQEAAYNQTIAIGLEVLRERNIQQERLNGLLRETADLVSMIETAEAAAAGTRSIEDLERRTAEADEFLGTLIFTPFQPNQTGDPNVGPPAPPPFVGPTIEPELLELRDELRAFADEVVTDFKFGLRNALNEGDFSDIGDIFLKSIQRSLNDRLVDGIAKIITPFFENLLISVFGQSTGTGGFGGLLGFQEGGFVPGRVGEPRLALVHGQELILNPEQQRSLFNQRGDTYNFTFGENTPPNIVDLINNNRRGFATFGAEVLRDARQIV